MIARRTSETFGPTAPSSAPDHQSADSNRMIQSYEEEEMFEAVVGSVQSPQDGVQTSEAFGSMVPSSAPDQLSPNSNRMIQSYKEEEEFEAEVGSPQSPQDGFGISCQPDSSSRKRQIKADLSEQWKIDWVEEYPEGSTHQGRDQYQKIQLQHQVSREHDKNMGTRALADTVYQPAQRSATSVSYTATAMADAATNNTAGTSSADLDVGIRDDDNQTHQILEETSKNDIDDSSMLGSNASYITDDATLSSCHAFRDAWKFFFSSMLSNHPEDISQQGYDPYQKIQLQRQPSMDSLHDENVETRDLADTVYRSIQRSATSLSYKAAVMADAAMNNTAVTSSADLLLDSLGMGVREDDDHTCLTLENSKNGVDDSSMLGSNVSYITDNGTLGGCNTFQDAWKVFVSSVLSNLDGREESVLLDRCMDACVSILFDPLTDNHCGPRSQASLPRSRRDQSARKTTKNSKGKTHSFFVMRNFKKADTDPSIRTMKSSKSSSQPTTGHKKKRLLWSQLGRRKQKDASISTESSATSDRSELSDEVSVGGDPPKQRTAFPRFLVPRSLSRSRSVRRKANVATDDQGSLALQHSRTNSLPRNELDGGEKGNASVSEKLLSHNVRQVPNPVSNKTESPITSIGNTCGRAGKNASQLKVSFNDNGWNNTDFVECTRPLSGWVADNTLPGVGILESISSEIEHSRSKFTADNEECKTASSQDGRNEETRCDGSRREKIHYDFLPIENFTLKNETETKSDESPAGPFTEETSVQADAVDFVTEKDGVSVHLLREMPRGAADCFPKNLHVGADCSPTQLTESYSSSQQINDHSGFNSPEDSSWQTSGELELCYGNIFGNDPLETNHDGTDHKKATTNLEAGEPDVIKSMDEAIPRGKSMFISKRRRKSTSLTSNRLTDTLNLAGKFLNTAKYKSLSNNRLDHQGWAYIDWIARKKTSKPSLDSNPINSEARTCEGLDESRQEIVNLSIQWNEERASRPHVETSIKTYIEDSCQVFDPIESERKEESVPPHEEQFEGSTKVSTALGLHAIRAFVLNRNVRAKIRRRNIYIPAIDEPSRPPTPECSISFEDEGARSDISIEQQVIDNQEAENISSQVESDDIFGFEVWDIPKKKVTT